MALMAAKDNSGIPRSLILDDITRSLVEVDLFEYALHEGNFFSAQYSNVVTNQNEKTAIGFNTPVSASKRIHMVVRAQVTDLTTFKFLENPSIDEAEETAAIVPFNRNRESSLTSLLADVTPVKATGGVLEWSDVAEELDSFSIGLDVYLITALEATATAANPNAIWIALGDAAKATIVANATAVIDTAQATSLNGPATVEALVNGDTIELDADNFGANCNLAVTVIVGANMVAGVNLTGGVGGLVQADAEYPGLVNSLSVYDETAAADANITTTTALVDEVIFGGTAVPTWDSKNGQLWTARSWILKPGYQYCAFLNADNNEDNTHRIILEWFEITHKTPASDF